MNPDFSQAELTASWAAGGPYDAPYMFRQEAESLLNSVCRRHGVTREELMRECLAGFPEQAGEDSVSPLAVYAEVLASVKESDLDTLYGGRRGYADLVGPDASLLQMLAVDSMRIHAYAWMNDRDPRVELGVDDEAPYPILFEEGVVIKKVGADPSLGQQTLESLHHIERLLHRRPRRAKRRRPAPAVEGHEEDRPDGTLESLARYTSDGQVPVFSSYWMAPPPVSPCDLYDLRRLTGDECALLLDLFLDVYQSEMLILGLYFLVKRLLSLWTRSPGESVEPALYRKAEREFIGEMLDAISDELSGSFACRFLATEGISLGGSRLHEGLAATRSVEVGDVDPVINIRSVLERQVSLLRDSHMALERTRVSLLYGRPHPSYVGDAFLSSLLSLFLKVQQANESFDSILDLAEPIEAMALPGDGDRITEFLEDLTEGLPGESKRHGIRESGPRRSYTDTSPTGQRLLSEVGSQERESLGAEGEIPSLRTDEPGTLLGILERAWQ